MSDPTNVNRSISVGFSPVDGHLVYFYTDTGEPEFLGDRVQLGWVEIKPEDAPGTGEGTLN